MQPGHPQPGSLAIRTSPRATLSPTRLFSATPSPPLLSLPAKTPASLTPSPTLPPPTSPTQDLVATIQAAGKPEVLQSSSSPDGKWRGEVVRYGCLQVSDKDRLAFEQILLFQAGSQAGQIVDSRLQSCEDMGDYSFRIEFLVLRRAVPVLYKRSAGDTGTLLPGLGAAARTPGGGQR